MQLLWDAYYTDKIPHVVPPVGSFWWRDILKLTPIFRGISQVQVVSGTSALFCKDLWGQDVLQITHPHAFSFAMHEDTSIKGFLETTSLAEAFHLPLSPQALSEVRDIQLLSLHMSPTTSVNDVWHYIWGKTEYRSPDYYQYFFRDAHAHPIFKSLWRSHCIMRIKVFGWLLFHDRLNTRNMLKQRHYDIGDDHSCLLCGGPDEATGAHMRFTCPFSQACWSQLGIVWPRFDCRLHVLQTTKDSWSGPLFLDIFLVAAWSLWKERNNKHFRRVDPSINSWLRRFKEDFGLLQHRTKRDHSALIASFLADL